MYNTAVLPWPQLPDVIGELANAARRFIGGLKGLIEDIILMAVVYTSAGEGWTADIFDGTTSNTAVPYYVAQGTGTTAAAKGDTTLETESAESRVSGTKSQPSADKNRVVATITATGTRAITEAGLLTASSSGTLIVRAVFSAINVVSGDSIEFTFEIEWT